MSGIEISRDISQYKPMIKGIMLENYLKLVIAFLTGERQINYLKKQNKKICLISLPWGKELIFAAGAVPIHFPRVGDFESHPIVKALTFGKKFGWINLMNAVRNLKRILGENYYAKFIYEIIYNIFANYDRYIKIGEEDGIFPLDACFGTRMLYGNIIDNAKDVDFSLGLGTRCNWFSKYFEVVRDFPKPDNSGVIPLLMLEIPNINDSNGFNTLKENINQLLAKIEDITEKSVTDNSLKKYAKLTNTIRRNIRKLMYFWSKEYIKLPPLAYTNLFALIHIAFTDLLG